MTTATALAVELVSFGPESARTQELFSALVQTAPKAGIEIRRTQNYRGFGSWLLLWGPGNPHRGAILKQHVKKGGHVLAFDLAYWNRQQKVRVSIDAPHPQAWVMSREWSRQRFTSDRPPIADVWNSTGPIVIAGIGDKARVQYGGAVDRWEMAMMQACGTRWPKRRVIYRKKRTKSPVPSWAKTVASEQPIDVILKDASLVITWHSNVAVDAIRLGIPAICQDGAAAAVCPSALGDADPQPLPVEVRDRFLGNLAWFQWRPNEAHDFWSWVTQVLA